MVTNMYRAAFALFISSMLLFATVHAASVPLIWDYVDNPENPALSFSMYRDVGCSNNSLFLASIPRNTPVYTDNTALAGQVYCYTVTAVGVNGEESSTSNVLMFQVPLPKPSAPSNLRRQ